MVGINPKLRAKGKRISTIYAGEATNIGASRLGAVTQNDLLVFFKLNSLFFDEIEIPSTSMLGNQHLLDLLRSSDIKLMYEQGIIKPIRTSSHTSLGDIAENMRLSRTIHNLGSDNLLTNHAEEIMKLGVSYQDSTGGDEFRDNFYNYTINTVDSLLREVSKKDLFQNQSLMKSEMSKFFNWLLAYPDEARILSDIFRYADRNLITPDLIKRLGFSMYSRAMADQVEAELSLPASCRYFVELAHDHNAVPLSEEESLYLNRNSERESLKIEVPYAEILELPLKNVLDIRNLDAFRKQREYLAQVRGDEIYPTFGELKSLSDECLNELYDAVSSWAENGQDALSWQKWLKLSRKRQGAIQRATFTIINITTPIGVERLLHSLLIPYIGDWPAEFLAVTAGLYTGKTLKLFNPYKKVANYKVRFIKKPETRIYNPVSGTLVIPELLSK